MFRGDDGTDFTTIAGQISVLVDGTPGVDDMPGRIEFSTTPDGAASVVKRVQIDSAGKATFYGDVQIDGDLDLNGTNLGFYGTTPAAKPAVSGSRAGNAALADLLTELATLGLITDSSTV